jgi:DNA-binding MarR family transcriptional regulator
MVRSVTASGARELTAAVTQLRRALRRSIRLDYPWESRPVAQIEVLQMLREAGAVRLGDLAARLNLAQSTVSGLVNQLVAAGLAVREADPRDRRALVAGLTPAGRAELAQWDAAHQKRLATALRTLDADDRATVLAAVPALSRLAAALNDRAGRPTRTGPPAAGSAGPSTRSAPASRRARDGSGR